MKFGGTSVGSPDRVKTVVQIIAGRLAAGPAAVVVSAFAGVTDKLVAAARAAAERDATHRKIHRELLEQHRTAIAELVHESEQTAIADLLELHFQDLRHLLRGVYLVQECSPRTLDSILSYGERLSVTFVAAALRRAGIPAEACDSRHLVITDAEFGNAKVDWAVTAPRIRERFAKSESLQVVTGFIGSTPRGETTTLGRGGSDYTASLVGAALDAEEIEIWTDVDGVMSADPRVVPNAFSLPSLSYAELQELSHFGAKVVYPPAVHPARERNVPLVIRNTLNPGFPGTRVEADAPPLDGRPVRGIASIPQVVMLRLEGDAMAGTPQFAQRTFGVLGDERIPLILITQASSGHSLCFAVQPGHLERARKRIEAEFELERRAGMIDDLIVEADCSVISAVGAAMKETPGIAGRLFGVLGQKRINVRAIAQGSSELNISLVVAADDHARALRAIHDAFFADDDAARGTREASSGQSRKGVLHL